MDNRQRPASKRLIIEKAIEIIKREKIDLLTMRKVANECGYAVSALYHHFSSKGELMLYASVPYLRSYLREVSIIWNSKQGSLNNYFEIERVFASYSFQEPSLMYNLYFGQESHKLDSVILNSFQLFSDWYSFLDEDLYDVLSLPGGISGRNLEMLQRLSLDGYLMITEQKNLALLNEGIVHIYRGFLNRAIELESQGLGFVELTEEYLKIHRFIHEPYIVSQAQSPT